MSTQKITSGSVTYFVCECGNPPQYCKCSELARIAHLEQQAARLANLPELPVSIECLISDIKSCEHKDWLLQLILAVYGESRCQ